jgi:exonuclease III
LKLATWNVNSLRLRLPRLIDWLGANAIDVLCLQETKLEDAAFPRLALEAAGFGCAFTGQRTCNGVAIAWRRELGSADDSFRLFEQPPNAFSWWDYRMLAFPKNKGLRIDHVLLSADLARRCTSCRIDRGARKGDKPSDHAPVIVEIAPHGAQAQ